jgi:adenine-specific DNA-methyltransferase
VFTRRWVVDTLLDLTGYVVDADLSALTLVEPAAGSGAFLLPTVDRLLESARKHGHRPKDLAGSVRAWELQPDNVKKCRSSLEVLLAKRSVPVTQARRLIDSWIITGDFLLPGDDLLSPGFDQVAADIVIGNPPYIRIEDLPAHLMAEYRRRWPTMAGRADIYVGFIERSLSVLRPGGRMGFICADRWMRNKYGEKLRHLVASDHSVEHVWALHDVDAFESHVSAYPAVVVLRREKQGSVVVADTTTDFGGASAAQLVRWTKKGESSSKSFEATGVAAHRLPHWFPVDESWPTGNPARLRLMEHLKTRFQPLHDRSTGTRVSIGVATGADQIFITKDGNAVEPDRLLPLSMASDLSTGEFKWSGNYLVDPWGPDGQLIDLHHYPRLARHYSEAALTLRKRYVAKKTPWNWYRTIDKVHHDLTAEPKLLLQDMNARIHPVLETGGHYPHHNLYYVVSGQWDMEVLGGLLLSRIAQAFIEAYCVRMRGGTLRFQSQYLKRIRVPDPGAMDGEVREALRDAFRLRDIDRATTSAAAAYGIETSDYDLD